MMTSVEERLLTVEERLAAMERLLEERLPAPPLRDKKGWQAIVGTFSNDPLYEEAMKRGREWREAQSEAPTNENEVVTPA